MEPANNRCGARCIARGLLTLDAQCSPGPSDLDSALWAAIFSDAITLVRSDRFYTVVSTTVYYKTLCKDAKAEQDWDTNSLTSWGMKEVTPDNNVLKSSVFHRLLQRAFPEWFPHDSIRFFHPFYTAQKNAEFAAQQGYAPNFRMQEIPPEHKLFALTSPKSQFDYRASNPSKPPKPIYLSTNAEIKAVLSQAPNFIVTPAYMHESALPEKLKQLIQSSEKSFDLTTDKDNIAVEPDLMMTYFTGLMREIVQREIITVGTTKNPVYQIDVIREYAYLSFRRVDCADRTFSLAIPVITRFVADFLGFGHRVRNIGNISAPFSENETYQDITNCQMFHSYNADETKLLKRQVAFKVCIFCLSIAGDGIKIYIRNGCQHMVTPLTKGQPLQIYENLKLKGC